MANSIILNKELPTTDVKLNIKRVCNHLNESRNHLMVDESTFKLLKKDQFDINIITH